MKTNRILIITAGLFILAGAVIAGIALMLTARSSEQNARMETYEVTEKISNVNIDVDMSDIKIMPVMGTDKITLTYFTDDTNKYDISEDNGTLSVKYMRFNKEKAKWYDYYFSFDFGRDHDVILQVPQNFRADLLLHADYGDIEVTDMSGDSMNIHTSYGDLDITGCKFKAMECATDYGDIDIERSQSDTFNCSTDFGSIDVTDTAGKINCGTDYGDIEFERISGASIVMDTSCGDIEGTIDGREADYTINAQTNLGDKNVQSRAGGEKRLDVKTDMGDIDIIFLK